MERSLTVDAHQRPLRSLRLSVTDRCNLRCAYCMPEEEYVWLKQPDILSFEELSRLVDAFTLLGVDRVRLTGGEPLVRRELPTLVRMLAEKPAIQDLSLTTNGVLLAEQIESVKRAGLHRVTVSLDTLKPERFRALTRRDLHAQVLAGIEAAARGLRGGLKLDTVVMRGVNDDELIALVAFAKAVDAELRFIEYMDVGGATGWSRAQVVSRAQMLAALERHYGPIEPLGGRGSAPAERFRLADGTSFGIIASTTAPFCQRCDRSRVTADGLWLLCLYAKTGHDLKRVLRSGASVEAIAQHLSALWSVRTDRGAEQRLALRDARTALFRPPDLRRNPHLEMHTRGG